MVHEWVLMVRKVGVDAPGEWREYEVQGRRKLFHRKKDVRRFLKKIETWAFENGHIGLLHRGSIMVYKRGNKPCWAYKAVRISSLAYKAVCKDASQRMEG